MPDKILFDLFVKYTGVEPTLIKKLSGAGSNRQYYRLTNNEISLIGVVGESTEENQAFIHIANHFAKRNLPVPRVVAVSPYDAYLQEDLGDTLLFDAIANGRATGCFSEEEKQLLRLSIRALADVQYRGARELDFSICYPQSDFDRRSVMWDLNYFKYDFLKMTKIPFNEGCLEDDFEHFANTLLSNKFSTFMYRDFQSRNVMIVDGKPRFIDFQGGRRGPATYDVASFLWQAKANIPQELRNELIAEYIDAASQYQTIDALEFHKELNYMVLFRLIQVLGAYGFRGLFEKKAHFVESIYPALQKIKEHLNQFTFEEYPTLREVLLKLVDKFAPTVSPEGLVVKIQSFSYKKGIPDDMSGNGGGYVFDCRGMHNPGRYAEYKSLTGRDRPVIDFLESRGEVQQFMAHATALVDSSVDTYLRRGFTSLCVSFGCTGGQHRSVYCAEAMARHINEKYGDKLHINLFHREQQS